MARPPRSIPMFRRPMPFSAPEQVPATADAEGKPDKPTAPVYFDIRAMVRVIQTLETRVTELEKKVGK